ncbi:MAG: preprotein translocase subunit SecG [Patescibacteria group bacterium]
MSAITSIINLITASLLIICVLLQNRGSSLSGALGGDSESYYTRRGLDRFLFFATIIISIIFTGSILANLIIS